MKEGTPAKIVFALACIFGTLTCLSLGTFVAMLFIGDSDDIVHAGFLTFCCLICTAGCRELYLMEKI